MCKHFFGAQMQRTTLETYYLSNLGIFKYFLDNTLQFFLKRTILEVEAYYLSNLGTFK